MNYIVYSLNSDHESVAECVCDCKETAEARVLELLSFGATADEIRIYAKINSNVEISIDF